MNGQARELPSPGVEAELLVWLLEALRPMNRTRVKQLLRSGRVTVNGTTAMRHDHLLHPGDRLAIASESAAPQLAQAGIGVLYMDDSLIAIDKPAGLLSVATNTEKLDTAFVRLRDLLDRQRGGRPFIVHRLDRETSGLLLFARSPDVRDRLQADWEKVTKTYLAVVEGQPKETEGTIESYLAEGRDLKVRAAKSSNPAAKRAVSRYRVLAARGPYALVEVTLVTGRKHQIRVHLAGIGHPVIGDKLYGAQTDPAGRLGLHAWRISFDQPKTHERIEVQAPFPERLKRVVGPAPT